MKFNGDKLSKIQATIPSQENVKKSKHIIFDDDDKDKNDGEVAVETKAQDKKQVSKKSQKNRKNAMDIGTQWYQTVCSSHLISIFN